jgi:hypothetical protein
MYLEQRPSLRKSAEGGYLLAKALRLQLPLWLTDSRIFVRDVARQDVGGGNDSDGA